MRANRKDDNHKHIVEALRKAGAHCIEMTGDPTIGFDLLIVHKGMKHIAEVKDGDKPESSRRLTDREMTRKSEVEARGVVYNIIESVDDALRLIGAIR